MIKIISMLASSSYRYGAKPILFRLKPDFVHESMIKIASLTQRFSLIRYLTKKSLSYEDTILRTEVFGITFKNPIGLSAGLDKDAKIVSMAESIGFGFIECGSVTLEAYEGNKKPWYTRLPKSKSIIVNSGLKSEGARAVINRVNGYPIHLLDSFPLNISIAKTNSEKTCDKQKGIEDYVESLKLWEKQGKARYYTINISCPNTFGGEPFTNPEDLESLLSAIDKVSVNKPIFVKFPIDKTWEESKELLGVCANHNVAGITFGNLYKDRSTVQLKDAYDPTIKGNFSGRPCWEVSNNLLKLTYEMYGDRFILSGVGGVFTAEDAYTKIRLGATLVEFITGLIFQGPAVVGQMNEGLAELLRKDGFSHVSEAVGVDTNRKKELKS